MPARCFQAGTRERTTRSGRALRVPATAQAHPRVAENGLLLTYDAHPQHPICGVHRDGKGMIHALESFSLREKVAARPDEGSDLRILHAGCVPSPLPLSRREREKHSCSPAGRGDLHGCLMGNQDEVGSEDRSCATLAGPGLQTAGGISTRTRETPDRRCRSRRRGTAPACVRQASGWPARTRTAAREKCSRRCRARCARHVA